MEKRVAVYNNNTGVIETMSSLLAGEGLKMVAVTGRAQLQELLRAQEIQLLLLDVELDGKGWGEGIEMIHDIRNMTTIPIIIISAQDAETAKIMALNAGADDYVTKPFYMGELLARIRVALRKSNQIPEEKKEKIFQCDYLKVDWEKHQVSIDGKEVHLTPMEYKILKLLIDNRGKVLTHNYILSQIWGSAQGVEAANLRVFMAALRRKIEKDPGNCRFILTEIGVGYRFREATE